LGLGLGLGLGLAGWQVGRLAGWQVGRLAGWQRLHAPHPLVVREVRLGTAHALYGDG
jgi:hypothetical protein